MDISSLRERNSCGSMTVSELNNLIKSLFDSNKLFTSVTVRGEISNFINHRSGHLYFTLKDSESQIRAIMFRSMAYSLKFAPENGMKVILHGSVNVYSRDGSYQIYVNSIQPDGIGALYLAYEQMKNRLSDEGLFDINHKKPIPKYPEKIGVITSPTGAAVRDIINVLKRRYPLATVYLYPSLVQGEGAEDNLIRALDFFDKSKLVDTVIIGRGGGSIEDLWSFNSERLARKIYDAEVPVISAVGHETDFTICDFVSDLRAPTPSASAELSVPDQRELIVRIDVSFERCVKALQRQVKASKERLKKVTESKIIKDPFLIFEDKNERLLNIKESLQSACIECLSSYKNSLSLISEKLYALNPLSVLSRGFSLVEKDSNAVTDSDSLKIDDEVVLRFKRGEAKARITKLKNDNSEYGL